MMSPEQFAQAVIAALQAQGMKGEIEYVRSEFELRIDSGDPRTSLRMNLGNAYHEYQNAPQGSQQTVIAKYVYINLKIVKDGVQLPCDYATAKPRLGLSVWSAATLDLLRCTAELDDYDPNAVRYVHRPLTDGLYVALAYDGGEYLRHLLERDVQKLSETPEVAMRDATANLLRKCALIDQIGSVFCFQTGDSYDSARIVLVEKLRQLPVNGHPVALVPDRDSLIIAGSADVDGLAQMAEMGLECFQTRSRLISGRPVILQEGRWIRFTPPEQVGEKFAQLSNSYDRLFYLQQTDVLRRLSEKRGDSAMVANVISIPVGSSNEFTTAATWVRGIPSLLPKVEMIAFMDALTGRPAIAAWDDVMRVVSHLMQPTRDIPPRYRVESYPTTAEMEAMGAQTIQPSHLTPRQPFRPR
jgi:uncharacterized protein YtpQ (UPF0354 family)